MQVPIKTGRPLLICAILFSLYECIHAQPSLSEPWRSDQLMAPAALAKVINTPSEAQPLIICVGPGAVIKGSVDAGPASDSANLDRLRDRLSHLPKNAYMIIYCGCCPFAHCPNIRPAFTLLNRMGFTHTLLLNITTNIKTDWLDKHYPRT